MADQRGRDQRRIPSIESHQKESSETKEENELHQGASVFRLGGSTIHPAILVPLLLMVAAFTLLFVTLLLAAMRNEILRRRVRTLRILQATAAG